ncbi:unnamed protein product [Mytilus edulis]|uniref:Uncharacterized protein n=1 Tax=Mytilus edulis TaxID=6550 RepID=A0A8S3PU76_MYTED|nr:unnamed protein product [Mytilus edulis]
MTKHLSIDINSVHSWNSYIHLSVDSIDQINFWRFNLHEANVKPFKTDVSWQTIVYSDASNTGYGGYIVENPYNIAHELLSESRAASTTKGYYQNFLRWKKWAILNGIENCDILPAKAFHVAIYLASLTQSSNTVSPVVQAFYSLKWIHSLIGSLCSPTDSSLVINVLEVYNHQD